MSINADDLRDKLKEKKQIRRESVQWEADASNGLSYQRMMHKVSLRHPRKLKDNQRIPYSLCGTSTGWYCLCKRLRKAEIRELGIGMSIYFKFLKYMMTVFFLLTLFSIPTMIIFYNSNTPDDFGKLPLNKKMFSFSLGNIGQRNLA